VLLFRDGDDEEDDEDSSRRRDEGLMLLSVMKEAGDDQLGMYVD